MEGDLTGRWVETKERRSERRVRMRLTLLQAEV